MPFGRLYLSCERNPAIPDPYPMLDQPAFPRTALIGCGLWGRNIARVLARLGALEVIVDPAANMLAAYAD